MAETIVSPGVLAIENDQSFITEQPVQAGAAIIGPTVKGKVGIPTLVTTYSDYLNRYGATFLSGSQTYSYLTSISAYNYFNRGGTSLLITRVVSGSTINDWTPATSSIIPTSNAATSASVSINLNYISASVAALGSSSLNINGVILYYTGSATLNTPNTIYINTASFSTTPGSPITLLDYVVTSSQIFNFSSSVSPYNIPWQFISSSANSPNLKLVSTNPNGLAGNLYYYVSGSTTIYFANSFFSAFNNAFNNAFNFGVISGTNTEAFVLETLSEGEIMNSVGPIGLNGTLLSGSSDNLRWQITDQNINEGTFTLIIRQGNDNFTSPSVLETWSNLSLDPFASNYVEKVIGNQLETIAFDSSTNEYYIQLNGNYSNMSRYVRVKQVNFTTPNYFDNNGNPKSEYTGSIPTASLGVFGDGQGKNTPTGIVGNYYENISDTNIQGLTAAAYVESISLLANKDAYNYNFITTPGLIGDPTFYPTHYPVTQQLVTMVQNRGDAMAIIDLVGYNSNILPVTTNAANFANTSYAAAYWPWLKTIDPNSANQVWVPSATMIPGVYAFNDSVSFPWFAPAGIDRGVMPTVIQAERVLTQGNRDLLYQNNVNSIATFPNTGITVFGQKTFQKKKSALDRVNVRRLLIELKNYISQIADTFVFEQNNTVTRNNFLSIINPYLFTIQQQQGLTTFKVIMDESNNTSTVIDNNQLIGQIYLQPTRTAEFIILDFNVLPTGATFPA
jgi:hypothetical protein